MNEGFFWFFLFKGLGYEVCVEVVGDDCVVFYQFYDGIVYVGVFCFCLIEDVDFVFFYYCFFVWEGFGVEEVEGEWFFIVQFYFECFFYVFYVIIFLSLFFFFGKFEFFCYFFFYVEFFVLVEF